ncbi:hypothetical protein J6590_040075, partial [Homalodisca vitripennis]
MTFLLRTKLNCPRPIKPRDDRTRINQTDPFCNLGVSDVETIQSSFVISLPTFLALIRRTWIPDTKSVTVSDFRRFSKQKYRRSTHSTHILFRYKFLLKWRTRLRTVLLPNDLLGRNRAGVSRISKFLSQLQLKLPRVSGYFRLTT